MGRVIQFEERAVAHLRERLGAAEEANQDLLAFARGHSGAVASIHDAMLAALEADSIEALFHVVTQEWPLILGLDAVALALIVGDQGFRADGNGVQSVEPQILDAGDRAGSTASKCASVERGHPLFGPACELIRAEALIRIDCEPPLPIGLIALGQRDRAEPRRASRLRIADVPWPQPCRYDPPVADHPQTGELAHEQPARALAASWAILPSARSPALGRTRCGPMSRRRTALSIFLGSIAARRSGASLCWR